MNKYDPLSNYLKSKSYDQVPMTFREIEQLIDDRLPPSARKHRAWWSNNPSNSVITKAWLDAGYLTREVDLAGEKLMFQRTKLQRRNDGGTPPRADAAEAAGGARPTMPSYFGAMIGTLKLDPSVDLTEPADPEWGKVYRDD